MSWTSEETPSFTGSSILKQSPPFHSLHTGPGGADLSLSELYISDRSEDAPVSKPFSLLPQHEEDANRQYSAEETVSDAEDERAGEADGDDPTVTDKRKRSSSDARSREERLQHDLLVLKKLNTAFSLYNDALKDTRSSTENVALQLDRTDRLLDQYVSLLQHTEKNAKLIFDETWEGGATDQEVLERLRVEAVRKAAREKEEREHAAQLAQERQEKEGRERKEKEERYARENEKRGSVPARGVRGLRARRAERGTSTVSRGRIASTSSTTVQRGISDTQPSRGTTVSRVGRRS